MRNVENWWWVVFVLLCGVIIVISCGVAFGQDPQNPMVQLKPLVNVEDIFVQLKGFISGPLVGFISMLLGLFLVWYSMDSMKYCFRAMATWADRKAKRETGYSPLPQDRFLFDHPSEKQASRESDRKERRERRKEYREKESDEESSW